MLNAASVYGVCFAGFCLAIRSSSLYGESVNILDNRKNFSSNVSFITRQDMATYIPIPFNIFLTLIFQIQYDRSLQVLCHSNGWILLIQRPTINQPTVWSFLDT